MSPAGRTAPCDPAAADLYGYTHDELLAMKNTDLSAEPEETQHVTQDTPVIPTEIVTVLSSRPACRVSRSALC